MINIKSIIEDSIFTKSQMMNLCIDDINNSAELMLRAVKNGKKKYYGVETVDQQLIRNIWLPN